MWTTTFPVIISDRWTQSSWRKGSARILISLYWISWRTLHLSHRSISFCNYKGHFSADRDCFKVFFSRSHSLWASTGSLEHTESLWYVTVTEHILPEAIRAWKMSKPRLSAVNNSNIYMTLILTAESGSQTNRSHRERYTYANTETPSCMIRGWVSRLRTCN